MKCKNCRNVISFESADICKRIFEEAKKIWFQIDEHSVSLIGSCKNCNFNN
jgi:Fe2+ or Zn2+ uptake regulation protein